MNTLINLNQITKSYNTPAGEFLALRGIDLQIGKGEFVAIVGKYGFAPFAWYRIVVGSTALIWLSLR